MKTLFQKREVLFGITAFLLVSASYVASDYYVKRTLGDFVTSWFAAEDTAIKEGNILTAISNYQRGVGHSQALKGIVVFDFGVVPLRELTSFGNRINLEQVQTPNSELKERWTVVGLFSYLFVRQIPADNKLAVAFLFEPEYARSFFLGYSALLVFLLALAIEATRRLDLYQQLKRKAVEEELTKLAFQVAHDIRSPLAALNMASRDMGALPTETQMLLRGAVGRITDIANKLLQKSDDPLEVLKVKQLDIVLVSTVVDSIVSEKRLEFRASPDLNIENEIGPADGALFIRADSIELKRIISNLINNATEAMDGRGRILLRIVATDDLIELHIKDHGKGIPSEILSKLGKRGETHGKEGGSGLGLYHAHECLELWGGSLSLQSEAKTGTTVLLKFPRASK